MTLLLAAAKPIPLGEKLLACAGIALFALIGLGLLRAAFLELRRVKRRRASLLRLEGTVVRVVQEERTSHGSGSQSESALHLHYFPVIRFTTPAGEPVEFRSELGESHQITTRMDGTRAAPRPPPWHDGDKIEIFYDPSGEMKPCLASAWALWFLGLGMLAAGLLFFGASVGMALLFSRKAFA